MKRRAVTLCHLRPEAVEEYQKHHQHVWPALEEIYRQAGITQVCCFLNEEQLLIYSEYDEEIFLAACTWLAAQPVEQQWQALLQPLTDQSFPVIEFAEVYHMS